MTKLGIILVTVKHFGKLFLQNQEKVSQNNEQVKIYNRLNARR